MREDGTQTVGIVGLGNMGTPMAVRLVEAGFRVLAWNRNPDRIGPLLAQGAAQAQSPAAACAGGLVLSMVADDAALDAVTLGPDGILAGLDAGGVHVSLSTVAPDTARRLAAAHAEHGSHYLAAPVFGRPDAAAAGKLWVVLSGPAAAKARFAPLIPILGQGHYDFGDDAGAANVVKLSGNFLIASAIEALGEALTLAEKNGIDPVAVSSFFAETLFACPVYRGYGRQIAEKRWSPAGFRLALGLKDVRLALAAAERSDVPLPIGSVLRDRLLSMRAQGDGDLDWSAMALGAARAAGLT